MPVPNDQERAAEDRAEVSGDAMEAATQFMARWGLGKAITEELSALLTRRESALRERVEALKELAKWPASYPANENIARMRERAALAAGEKEPACLTKHPQ